MKGKIHIKNISELLPSGTSPTDIRVKINCTTIDSTDVLSQFSVPLYLNASIAILVLSGNATACILTCYESIIKSFIELLVANYRKEHKVDFYSSRLNISDHYLIHIVKRITGQTVTDFIYEMLYSDARTLLMHSKLSIQEITSLLHFSDQSSFGKFFKRKAGLSPIDFRKQKN